MFCFDAASPLLSLPSRPATALTYATGRHGGYNYKEPSLDTVGAIFLILVQGTEEERKPATLSAGQQTKALRNNPA